MRALWRACGLALMAASSVVTGARAEEPPEAVDAGGSDEHDAGGEEARGEHDDAEDDDADDARPDAARDGGVGGGDRGEGERDGGDRGAVPRLDVPPERTTTREPPDEHVRHEHVHDGHDEAPSHDPAPDHGRDEPATEPHEHIHSHPHVHDEVSGLPLYGASVVVARGAATPPRRGPTEVELAPAALARVPRFTTESLLTAAPSVILLNHGGSYHASTFMLRGFDAGEGQDLEMTVDGAPLNEPSNAHAHGYLDLHGVIPEAVRRATLVEGPFDLGAGDFSIAGSGALTPGVRQRGFRLEGRYGSFDEGRLLFTYSPSALDHAERGESFVAIDLRRGDGFGIRRGSESAALNVRFAERLSASTRYSLFLLAHAAQFDQAGVVRRDDVDAGRLPCAAGSDAQFFCSYDAWQGGDTSRLLGVLGLETREGRLTMEHHVFAGPRHLRLRENFVGFAVDPRGGGQDERYDAWVFGARGRLRASGRVLGEEQTIELGYVLRHDAVDTRFDRVRAVTFIPYASDTDAALSLTQIGAHLGLELTFAPWLRLQGGTRIDAFSYGVVRRGRPASDRDGPRVTSDSFDTFGVAISPRATLSFVPSNDVAIELAVGTGTRSADATRLGDGDAVPFSRAVSEELGARGRVTTGSLLLAVRGSVFHTHVERELVFDAIAGRNLDAGRSSRLGAMGLVELEVARVASVRASFAWTEAFLLGATGGFTDFVSSTRIPFVPRWTGRLDGEAHAELAVFDAPLIVSFALGVTALGERPLPLGDAAGPSVVADAQVSLRHRGVELGLVGTNLFDARYMSSVYRYVSSFEAGAPVSRVPELHFAAASPLSLALRLSVALDDAPLFGVADEPEGETEEADVATR